MVSEAERRKQKQAEYDRQHAVEQQQARMKAQRQEQERARVKAQHAVEQHLERLRRSAKDDTTGFNEASSLIGKLSAGWQFGSGFGSATLGSVEREDGGHDRGVSLSDTATANSGYHAYYRTKRAGASSKMEDRHHPAAEVAEVLERQFSANDAADYYRRTRVSDEVADAHAIGVLSMNDEPISLMDLAMLYNTGHAEVADAVFDAVRTGARGVDFTIGTERDHNVRFVRRDRLDDAQAFVKDHVTSWIKEISDRTPPGKYAPLVRASAAVNQELLAQKFWERKPPLRPQQQGGGGQGKDEEGKDESSSGAGPGTPRSLDELLAALEGDWEKQASELEKEVEEAQAELDDKKADPLAFLGGVGKIPERGAGQSFPMRPEYGVKLKGMLSQLQDRKKTKLGDTGAISAPDVWEMLYGQTDIWEEPQRKAGKLLVLADASSSTGCTCGGAPDTAVGAVIAGVAQGIAGSFANSEVWAYSDGRQRIPPGHHVACNMHESDKSVHGAGTPDLKMLKWATEREKHMDGVSIVIVCDGGPNDPTGTKKFAEYLVKGGVRFCSVVIRGFRPEKVEANVKRYRALLDQEKDPAMRGYIQQTLAQWAGTSVYPASAAVAMSATPWTDPDNARRHGVTKRGELMKLRRVFKVLDQRH